MFSTSCPACGAQVQFQSNLSIFAVCSYCQSALVRRDFDLENLGKMSIPLNDVSPLQLGTEGTYEGEHFTLIGRVKKNWEDGYWNEWHAWFDSGNSGWLAEAQGFYSICFEIPYKEDYLKIKNLSPGHLFPISETDFYVADIKKNRIEFGEGELPYIGQVGAESISIDLNADPNLFACIEQSEMKTVFYRGYYLPFPSFKFQRLRELEGW